MSGKILVTGGLGYIGSHTVIELVNAGYEPIIIDNLSNSDLSVLDAIQKITGKEVAFEQVEMCSEQEMESFFLENTDIVASIHFAAFLQVKESVENPNKYYRNNLISTMNLIDSLKRSGSSKMVFSSSCTVYGNPEELPVTENAPVQPAESPYGNTKKMCEELLKDASSAYNLDVISLRYFNPIGAHPSALIGEVQRGEPHHLVPYITETALGIRNELRVFGDDYNTPDGSCIRDYIHVVDLAKAHVKAIDRLLMQKEEGKFEVFNIGTGAGSSVFEMIKAFIGATGIDIKYTVTERRPGDVEAVYASTDLAEKKLNWKAKLSLEDCLRDAWRWQENQPK